MEISVLSSNPLLKIAILLILNSLSKSKELKEGDVNEKWEREGKGNFQRSLRSSLSELNLCKNTGGDGSRHENGLGN